MGQSCYLVVHRLGIEPWSHEPFGLVSNALTAEPPYHLLDLFMEQKESMHKVQSAKCQSTTCVYV